MNREQVITDLVNQMNNLKDALDAEGVCTSRECMCDTSAPLVKLDAAVAQAIILLEAQNETQPTQEGKQSKASV